MKKSGRSAEKWTDDIQHARLCAPSHLGFLVAALCPFFPQQDQVRLVLVNIRLNQLTTRKCAGIGERGEKERKEFCALTRRTWKFGYHCIGRYFSLE